MNRTVNYLADMKNRPWSTEAADLLSTYFMAEAPVELVMVAGFLQQAATGTYPVIPAPVYIKQAVWCRNIDNNRELVAALEDLL